MNMQAKSLAHAPGPAHSALDDLLSRVRGEYDEMPGLSLTMPQAQRLWALDQQTCAVVLRTLVEGRFLRRTPHGRYVRSEQARGVNGSANVDTRHRKGTVVYVYLSAGHKRGSAEALELAHQLSCWHDEMVIHARAVARDGAGVQCNESCPHARAIELWAAAREMLGEAAHQLAFLKAAAGASDTEADASVAFEPVEHAVGSTASEPSRRVDGITRGGHEKSSARS